VTAADHAPWIPLRPTPPSPRREEDFKRKCILVNEISDRLGLRNRDVRSFLMEDEVEPVLNGDRDQRLVRRPKG
jgi:hypothetical protein